MRVRNFFLLLVLLVLTVSGCSKPSGTVTGNVTLDGEPLPAGAVFMANDKMQTWQGVVTDGKYQIDDVEPGAVNVAVVSYAGSSMIGTGVGTDVTKTTAVDKSGDKFKIPKKYNDVKTSDLTYTVVDGPQSHDIALSKKQ